MARIALEGPGLVGFPPVEVTGSLRLLLPDPAAGQLVLPTWTGNEFLSPDGERPRIRTLTPVELDAVAGSCELWIVRHDQGALRPWLDTLDADGCEVAVSGPARGVTGTEVWREVILGADESSLAALTQLLAALPHDAAGVAVVGVRSDEAVIDLAGPPGVDIAWLVAPSGGAPGALVADALIELTPSSTGRVWMAADAPSVQRVRRHFTQAVGWPRERVVARGYWK